MFSRIRCEVWFLVVKRTKRILNPNQVASETGFGHGRLFVV